MHERFAKSGAVDWIGLSPGRREIVVEVDEVQARPGTGLEGDRHAASGRAGNKRQVTLIQAEHFAVMSALTGREVRPADCRRNLVVSGIPLYAMRNARFRVGEVLLQGTGICAPCSRMEENLGPGGFNAMRGHGGICAQVIEGGAIRIGDQVQHVAGGAPSGEE